MKFAFCLFHYFPYGGLQRDFLRMASLCQARGHHVDVYTMAWEGAPLPPFAVHIVPVTGLFNHQRCAAFVRQVQAFISDGRYDVVIGFNKMPGLDVYYAADVCYQARIRATRPRIYRWLPRYRTYAAYEQAVFDAHAKTRILILSPKQQDEYHACYQTPATRFFLLPPGIERRSLAGGASSAAVRAMVREAYRLSPTDFLLLMVGSGFKTKGVDRLIRTLALLPISLQQRCHVLIIGQGKPAPYQRLAKQLGVSAAIHFLGGRADVPDFMAAADVLVHPAYHETAGMVMVEALAAGLPVLTTDACGYAHYVQTAQAGTVVASPFQVSTFAAALEAMLVSGDWSLWRERALAFAAHTDLYALPMTVVELLEQWRGGAHAAVSAPAT